MVVPAHLILPPHVPASPGLYTGARTEAGTEAGSEVVHSSGGESSGEDLVCVTQQ